MLNSYLDGNLVLEIKSQAENELRSGVGRLKPEEAAVLAMLRGQLAKEAEKSASANAKTSSGKRPARAAASCSRLTRSPLRTLCRPLNQR